MTPTWLALALRPAACSPQLNSGEPPCARHHRTGGRFRPCPSPGVGVGSPKVKARRLRLDACEVANTHAGCRASEPSPLVPSSARELAAGRRCRGSKQSPPPMLLLLQRQGMKPSGGGGRADELAGSRQGLHETRKQVVSVRATDQTHAGVYMLTAGSCYVLTWYCA